MKVIYKYPLNVHGQSIVPVPDGAELLSIDVQMGVLVSWWLIDKEVEEVKNPKFLSLMTGEPFDSSDIIMKFIQTVQIDDDSMPNGKFVVHIFSIRDKQ